MSSQSMLTRIHLKGYAASPHLAGTYIYLGIIEKTRVGKRRVVNADEGGFEGALHSPIERQDGETEVIKFGEGSTKTVQQQQGAR